MVVGAPAATEVAVGSRGTKVVEWTAVEIAAAGSALAALVRAKTAACSVAAGERTVAPPALTVLTAAAVAMAQAMAVATVVAVAEVMAVAAAAASMVAVTATEAAAREAASIAWQHWRCLQSGSCVRRTVFRARM